MISPWLLDLLSREWNWRAALRRIAGELAARSPSLLATSPRDHALACADVARALEHVEPDRRFAIASYQQAGPERDGGRALALAIEAGWWPVVGTLAMRDRTATGSLDAMVWEARALVDTGERDRADKLLPIAPSDARLAALRAELAGGSLAVFEHWMMRARSLRGPLASEAYLIAARQGRALGRDDWEEPLRRAALADPGHSGVVAMQIEQCFGDGQRDSRGLLELLRQRLSLFEERGDLTAWCDATRLAAMRLWLGTDAERHRGLARRLLVAALERAYGEGVTEISGHLAMWAVLDEAAAADQTRTELLGLVVSALDVELPVSDRIWLAALGAEICASVSNLQAANAYAAVVVELAPLHPVVRDYFAGTVAAPMPPKQLQLEAFRDALLELDVKPWQELQIEEMASLSLHDIELAPSVVAPEQASVAIEVALKSAVPVMDGDDVIESDGVVIDDLGDRSGGNGRVSRRAETVESGPVGTRPLRGGNREGMLRRAETEERWPALSRMAGGEAAPVRPRAEPMERAPTARVTSPISSGIPVAPASSTGSGSSDALDDAWSMEPEVPARSRRGSRSLESIPPILETPAGAPGASGAAGVPLAPVHDATTTTSKRFDSEAIATARLRPPTGTVLTTPFRTKAEPAGTATGTSSIATSRAAPPAAPRTGTIIPSIVRNAMSGGMKPRPLPPKPEPPAALPRARRVTLSMDLRLSLGGRELVMQSRDVSSSGLFAVTAEALPIGEILEGELRVPSSGTSEEPHRLRVRVVRRSKIGYGCELVSPSAELAAALGRLVPRGSLDHPPSMSPAPSTSPAPSMSRAPSTSPTPPTSPTRPAGSPDNRAT
jgi:PilZ domain